jgi:hypothetical protein
MTPRLGEGERHQSASGHSRELGFDPHSDCPAGPPSTYFRLAWLGWEHQGHNGQQVVCPQGPVCLEWTGGWRGCGPAVDPARVWSPLKRCSGCSQGTDFQVTDYFIPGLVAQLQFLASQPASLLSAGLWAAAVSRAPSRPCALVWWVLPSA